MLHNKHSGSQNESPKLDINDLVENPICDGLPHGIRFSIAGQKLFSPVADIEIGDAELRPLIDSSDDDQRNHAEALYWSDNKRSLQRAESAVLLPIVEKHGNDLEQLIEREVDDRDLVHRVDTGTRLRTDRPRAVVVVSALVLLILLAFGGYAFYAEIDTGVASVQTGGLFETPAADPDAPPIPATFWRALAFSFLPISGLLFWLKFYFFSSQPKERPRLTKVFAMWSLPLILTATFLFCRIVGSGLEERSIFEDVPNEWPSRSVSMAITMLALATLTTMILMMAKSQWDSFFTTITTMNEKHADHQDHLAHLRFALIENAATVGKLRDVQQRHRDELVTFLYDIKAKIAELRREREKAILRRKLEELE